MTEMIVITYLQDVEPGSGGYTFYPTSPQLLYPTSEQALNWVATDESKDVMDQVKINVQPIEFTGKAGDVVMFSETLLHTGTAKTTDGHRTNLYINYIEATYNPAMRELLAGNQGNVNHYVFPPEVRSRFDDTQRELTQWMEWQRTAPA